MEAFLGQVSRCQQQKGRGRQGPLLVPGKPHSRAGSAPASPIPGVLGGVMGVTTSPHPARRLRRQVRPTPRPSVCRLLMSSQAGRISGLFGDGRAGEKSEGVALSLSVASAWLPALSWLSGHIFPCGHCTVCPA